MFNELKKKIDNNNQFINNTDYLKKLVYEYGAISPNSKAVKYINNGIMPVKIGNEKIGDDTIIINCNHALNCYCSKKGYCNMRKKCYAKKSSNTYINSCLYNLAAEINFRTLSAEKIISDIEKIINKSNTEIKFIRFNESGDFTRYTDFIKANQIATYFLKEYNIVSYTYTHNVELEPFIKDIASSNIVLNYSYDVKTDLKVKKCIVVDKQDIKRYINNENYNICGGSCTNCSYCKNQKDIKTVVFVNHSQKSTENLLKEVLTREDLIKLESNKLLDYSKFLLDLI